MLFLSIPKPCHENWNEMSPREQGAFCGVCSKTVVDFTALSDEEVKNYFIQHREQKTCGRFRSQQLSPAENPLQQLLAENIPFWKKFLAIVVILFGSFLSGCHESVYEKKDDSLPMTFGVTETKMTEQMLMGESQLEESKATKKACPAVFRTDEIAWIEIKGDIAIEPPVFEATLPEPVKIIDSPLYKIDSLKKNCDDKKTDSTFY